MNNITTPIKAAICGWISMKLTVLLGLGEADASMVAASAWIVVTAALSFALPADLGVFGAIRERLR